MRNDEMVDWEEDKSLVLYRLNQLDKKVDHFDERFEKLQETQTSLGKQIDGLRVDIIKMVTENKVDLGLFKKEFKLKTSAWAFLGTAIALSLAVIGYLIKNQLV